MYIIIVMKLADFLCFFLSLTFYLFMYVFIYIFIYFTGSGVGGVASQTAKRILETLEKMSSPLVVSLNHLMGSMGDIVMKALVSHQDNPSLIP